ncbi:MAG: hypothetical protein KCHDKBKB_02830 [Elusimicrobia bacterium]|nr:hypothetical protein [Elusimicrobiota bacterium]
MTDNVLDTVFEIDRSGSLVRTIDISKLKNPFETTTDAEGITWMYGTTYAIVMESAEEMAVVEILPSTISLERTQARIFDLFGDPKGVAYNASEDAIYWVSQTGPLRVVKSRINEGKGTLDLIWNRVVDNLPDGGLADIAFFPRLSKNPFLIGQSSHTIMEVDMSGKTAVVVSSFSLTAWRIPRPGAMAFDSDGSFRVVGKHLKDVPEDDFNIFTPLSPIPNLPPIANAGNNIVAIAFNGLTSLVNIDGTLSIDPDGAIIDYQWLVNNVVVATGYSPRVKRLSHSFALGVSTVTLIVRDDSLVTTQTIVEVMVRPWTEQDHLPTPFEQPINFPATSLNYIHPGSLIQSAEFYFSLSETGFADIRIYDQLGRKIKEFKTDVFPPGQYRAPWDLLNENGEPVSSGVYFVLIESQGQVKKEKLVVVR